MFIIFLFCVKIFWFSEKPQVRISVHTIFSITNGWIVQFAWYSYLNTSSLFFCISEKCFVPIKKKVCMYSVIYAIVAFPKMVVALYSCLSFGFTALISLWKTGNFNASQWTLIPFILAACESKFYCFRSVLSLYFWPLLKTELEDFCIKTDSCEICVHWNCTCWKMSLEYKILEVTYNSWS